MAYREHCILVKHKVDLYLLPSLIIIVLHRLVQSESMTQTSQLVSMDISIVSIFIQFDCMPMSRFSISVWCRGNLSPGCMVAWFKCTSDFLRWPSHTLSYFTLRRVFGLTYTHPYPQYIVATYDLPCTEDITLNFILWVSMVYPCSLYYI